MEAIQEINTALRKQVVDLLTTHNVMATPQRVDVGEVLFFKPQHVSAEQILDALNRGGKSVSKATVYNTLNLFVERRLVRPVHVDSTRVVYDSTRTPHHHFLNVNTGELTDVPVDDVVIMKLPELPSGTITDGVDVIIRIRDQS